MGRREYKGGCNKWGWGVVDKCSLGPRQNIVSTTSGVQEIDAFHHTNTTPLETQWAYTDPHVMLLLSIHVLCYNVNKINFVSCLLDINMLLRCLHRRTPPHRFPHSAGGMVVQAKAAL